MRFLDTHLRWIVLAAMILAIAIFAGCDGDDDEGGGIPDNLVGTWNLLLNEDPGFIYPDLLNSVLVIDENTPAPRLAYQATLWSLLEPEATSMSPSPSRSAA